MAEEVNNMEKIGVIGAGRMGSAMSYLLLEKGKMVKIWDRNPGILQKVRANRESPHLPGVKLRGILTEVEIREVIKGVDLVILAVPSFAVREICQMLRLTTEVQKLPPILMISKGMEEKTSLLPFQVVKEVLGEVPILHITGVGYAQEVNGRIPVTEVLASKNELLLSRVKGLFETNWLKIETTKDLLGVQLGGALKNVMVIGIGMIETLKPNLKLRERLITEGITEMVRLGGVMGAEKETFFGPAGKGDLELSTDSRSRNYTLGTRLIREGLEKAMKDLETQGITVEGFHTATAATNLTRGFQVKLPLIELVNEAIEGESIKEVVENLLSQI